MGGRRQASSFAALAFLVEGVALWDALRIVEQNVGSRTLRDFLEARPRLQATAQLLESRRVRTHSSKPRRHQLLPNLCDFVRSTYGIGERLAFAASVCAREASDIRSAFLA